jgi:hypothetical protein
MSDDPELEQALRFLDDIDATAETADADEPHSVIAFDAYTETYTVTGPYPDAHTATIAAERIKAELNEAAGAPGYPPIQTWVAMHFPADSG